MAFESINDFLRMGTHGLYVWLAYGAAAVAVLWNVIQPLWRRHHLLEEQYAQIKRAKRDEQLSSDKR